MPTSARTSWKAKVMLVAFGFLLVGFTLEVGLGVNAWLAERGARRQAGAAPAGGEYWAIYDPDLGYRLNPKWGDINPQGLRDHPVGPKAGRFRLLMLGDSVAQYGETVDDTFVGHLRRELRTTRGLAGIDVLNAGIKGYTNYQELLFLKKYGLSFEPDLVGVQFCLNDLHRFLHSFVVEDGRIVFGTYRFSAEALESHQAHRPAAPRHGLLRRLADRSHLLGWLREKLPVALQAVVWKTSGGFSFDYRLDIANAWRDDPWPAIEAQLQEMLALGRRHRFQVFVAAVPVASQYDPAYLARDRAYVLKPQRRLREICERLGIPFYDLYPHLSASVFDEDAIHLTKQGRQAVGRVLADFLTRAGLIPGAS